MTHAELVERAERWLRNTRKCPVVLTELCTSMEVPDAIGWKYGHHSTLVECKVSRADFLRDARKLPRSSLEYAVGAERFYMTPPGLLSPDELPEHWGLLEAEGRTVKVVRDSTRDDRRSVGGMRRELGLLVSALRRIEWRLSPATVNQWIREMNAAERQRKQELRNAYARGNEGPNPSLIRSGMEVRRTTPSPP